MAAETASSAVVCYGCGGSTTFVRLVELRLESGVFRAKDLDYLRCAGCGFIYKVALDKDVVKGGV